MPMVWLLISCGSSTSPDVVADAPLSSVTLEVAYTPEAVPRTGGFRRVEDVWSLTQANLEALFPGVPVTVPHDLLEMQALEPPEEGTDDAFTADEILAISRRSRQVLPAAGEAAYHVLYLDGRFEDDTGVRESVLGVSLGGTSVVALFAPVIEGASPVEAVRAFVEQTTLVHEIGHAVGLVNRGLEMVVDHEDPDNRGHDANSSCVMYWANEGVEDIVEFVGQVIQKDSVVLFDDACVDDVHAGFNLTR